MSYEPITIRVLNNDVELTDECYCVHDARNDYQPHPECNQCKGEGHYVTENGEAILELVKEFGEKS